jgi:hypothetical protein
LIKLDKNYNLVFDYFINVGIQTKNFIIACTYEFQIISFSSSKLIKYKILENNIYKCAELTPSFDLVYVKPVYKINKRICDYLYLFSSDNAISKVNVDSMLVKYVGKLENKIPTDHISIIYSRALNKPLICIFSFENNCLDIYCELYEDIIEKIKIKKINVNLFCKIIPCNNFFFGLSEKNMKFEKILIDVTL